LCQADGTITDEDPGVEPPIVEPATAPASPFPETDSAAPNAVWREYFAANSPDPADVRRLIRRLVEDGRHEHVIAVIQSALLNGQSQPWMYEVLALSMENAGYPDNEVQRVVMSLVDFAGTDFETMMISAAYLVRFERQASALRLYQQASRIMPERPEPYVLGLRLAREEESADDVEWAACGILRHCWTHDFADHHQRAEDAAVLAAGWLRDAGQTEEAAALEQAVADARQRDLVVRLEWSGNSDLDLVVEEPLGSVCSFTERDSAGGGILVHDGYGPRAENCYESYVCSLGMPGDYRFRVRHAWGQVVGGRALITITQHQGTEREETTRQVVVLDGGESAVTCHLADGRRTMPRTVASNTLLQPFELPEARRPASIRGLDAKVELVAGEFEGEHMPGAPVPSMRPGFGAIGFQSVIQTIPEGASLSAAAVVSADRRYVRIGVVPLFSTITDVFTFSFIGGAGGSQTGGGGGVSP
jgi:hypothetical protein